MIWKSGKEKMWCRKIGIIYKACHYHVQYVSSLLVLVGISMGYSFHDVNIEYMKLQCESVSVFLPDKVNWKSANSLLPFTPGYLLRHQHCKNRGYIHQFHTTKEIPTCIDISSCLSNIILANITVLACKICTYITGHCMDKPK